MPEIMDYLRKDSLYQRFPWGPNVHGLWSQEITHVDFPELGVRVTGCSYKNREITAPLYDRLKKSGEDAGGDPAGPWRR